MLYNRGMISAMLSVEAHAQGAGQVRQEAAAPARRCAGALENLNLDAATIKALGFDGIVQPLKTTCKDHEGVRTRRASRPGTARSGAYTSDWYEADKKIIKPMIDSTAKAYAAEKKIEIARLLEGFLT